MSAVAGKVVFIKMFAPWCGHCKAMEPDWNRLMAEYANSETKLIADVDCTAAGEPICDNNAVASFPTLKFGDPYALEDYTGDRTYDDLKKFIDEELKPMCSAINIDLCDDDQKKEIETFAALTLEELVAKIKAEEEKIINLKERYEVDVEKLQQEYQKLMDDHAAAERAIQGAELGTMKAVFASKISGQTKKDEL